MQCDASVPLSRRTLLRSALGLGVAPRLLLRAPCELTAALAQAILTPEQALQQIFTAPQLSQDWFAPQFLAQVPLDRLAALIQSLNAALGSFQGVETVGDGYDVIYSSGRVHARITLDDQGRIAGLLLGQPRATPSLDSFDEAVANLQALPGSLSVLVNRAGVEIQSVQADALLAVGSAFKLAVLAALRQQADSGQRNWSDVTTLQPQFKSLPRGILQSWPDGAPLTLYALAALMISRSDNTAADTLLQLVGRDAVEMLVPAQDRPFLSTREAFMLKDPANAALLQQYESGTEAQKRQVLAQTASLPLPDASTVSGARLSPSVEWFFSVRQLCDLMARVTDLDLMTINPGLQFSDRWQRTAFKGGSEPGVINVTWSLQSQSSESYCVSVTWNNRAGTDENRFLLLVNKLLDSLP